MQGTSYAPGDWCVIIADGGFAALQGDIPADLATRIWERLGRGNGLSSVLEALTGAFGTSLAAIPPFAVALTEGASLRIAVRGDITAHVVGDAAADTVTGAGVTTWSERIIADARTLDVTLPGVQATDVSYPIVDGIVFASRFRVELAGSADVDAAAPRVARSPAAPVTEPTAAPVTEPTTAPVTEPIAPPAPAHPADVLIDSAAVLSAADGDTLLPVESTIGPAPAGEYDHLWGETVARPIEEAAVRPLESEAAPQTEAAPPTPAAGDHDGATISLAQARALRGATTDPPATPAATAPRVGRIRLSTGDVVALDRTVVIGRRPRSTRVSGTALPHLIAVDSPQQDISRSHVEIRPEGDSVIVVDLHTTNGTTLLRAGSEPVRLHPGEQTVVVSGDVIDLGDGITVAFEDLP